MQINRTTVLVGGALLAAWFAAAGTYRVPPAPARQAPIVEQSNRSPSEIEAEAARLRELLTARPMLRSAGRNPFRFAPRERIVAPRATPPPADVVVEPPPAQAVKLVGIAEDAASRTAILTVNGQLFLAREGEAVESRYRVEKVGAEAAELQDLTTGGLITVVLQR